MSKSVDFTGFKATPKDVGITGNSPRDGDGRKLPPPVELPPSVDFTGFKATPKGVRITGNSPRIKTHVTDGDRRTRRKKKGGRRSRRNRKTTKRKWGFGLF